MSITGNTENAAVYTNHSFMKLCSLFISMPQVQYNGSFREQAEYVINTCFLVMRVFCLFWGFFGYIFGPLPPPIFLDNLQI